MNVLPRPIKYKRAVNNLRRWLARKGYNVQYFMPWNEPNHIEPTKSHAKRTGHLYRTLFNLCTKLLAGLPACTAIADDFLLDSKVTGRYLRRYKLGAKIKPKIWAVHPYSDGQNRNHKNLKAFLKKTHESTDVWFSETGGIIPEGIPTRVLKRLVEDCAPTHKVGLLQCTRSTPPYHEVLRLPVQRGA